MICTHFLTTNCLLYKTAVVRHRSREGSEHGLNFNEENSFDAATLPGRQRFALLQLTGFSLCCEGREGGEPSEILRTARVDNPLLVSPLPAAAVRQVASYSSCPALLHSPHTAQCNLSANLQNCGQSGRYTQNWQAFLHPAMALSFTFILDERKSVLNVDGNG